MNPSTIMPSMQIIFSWILLSVLCAWTLLCAFLALRPPKSEPRQKTTSLESLPLLLAPQTPRHFAPSHTLSPEVVVIASEEATNDVGAAPVA